LSCRRTSKPEDILLEIMQPEEYRERMKKKE
jgi:hypothetical protein